MSPRQWRIESRNALLAGSRLGAQRHHEKALARHERIREWVRVNPTWQRRRVADALGVTERTVYRALRVTHVP